MKRMSAWKGLLLLSAVCLGWTPVSAELAKEDYMAVMLDGHKVGHALQTRTVSDDTVTSVTELSLTVGRGAVATTMNIRNISRETLDGRPIGFECIQKLSLIEEKRTGVIAPDGTVRMTIERPGESRTLTLQCPQEALLAEGMRLLQKQKGLKPGTEYEFQALLPPMLEKLVAVPHRVKVGDRKTIDLFGRVVEATEVFTRMTIGMESFTSISYLDEEHNVLKSIEPIMGLTIEMIRCDKEFALRQEDVVDFVSKMCVPCPEELKNPDQAAGAVYELRSLKGGELRLPEDDSQKVERIGEGRCRLIVRPARCETGFQIPYAGDDPVLREAVEPSEYLQSDDPKIKELAVNAVGQAQDAALAARKIEAFVAGYITTKDMSVGYASAREVAFSRQGDCSEHAVLTAAMCRAVGIPARVVTGMVYAENFAGKRSIFGGHAWAEAWTGEQWIGLDATRSPNGYGPGHIALARGNGSPADFFSLVNSFGSFAIDKVTLEKKKP